MYKVLRLHANNDYLVDIVDVSMDKVRSEESKGKLVINNQNMPEEKFNHEFWLD